ncbi:ABC transporter permease [Halopiger xanaduensis]|uniref:ABC-type transporter, integral membrane subunit n=1 Tax=Halopiger xanaduensis (strain DSM 18323 / JCM 14033 / SH-6) TaxID=797210 RepID=F8DDF1_HALXS|nr:ABC transporter permease [Halopiger xanaduensis]AEH39045.1 ABC-type transporter, integral membrane subunit [Halopiger xanaduensis SH-6]
MDWKIRRFGQALFTVWAVVSLTFFITRMMPGNPVDALVAQIGPQLENPQEAYELAETYMNINPQDPLHIAYMDYMGSMLQGDLGHSMSQNASVNALMAEAIPWTLFVMSWAIAISFVVGISLGAIMAYWEGSTFDTVLTGYATTITSIPFYVLALLLLIVFAYQLGWFPTGGRQPSGVEAGFNLPFMLGIIHHAALPVISMLVGSGAASLTMRGNSVRILGEDYLRVARLRGLADRTIAVRYVARNAILPMYTGLMIAIGTMFGGAVVLEEIYTYRGMGYYMIQAVRMRDYPLMMGAFTVITVAVVIALLIADLTYGKIDPRAGGGNREAF